MSISFESLLTSLKFGLKAFPVTLELIAVSLALGLVLGCVIAFIRAYKVPFLGKFFGAFINVYQGVPFVVALLIYHLILLTCFPKVETIVIGILAMTLVAVCNSSEAFRGVLLAIDRGQYEAGYSVGLTEFETIRRIILPQVISHALPMLTNNVIGLIKASSIVSVVGIIEVTQGSLIPSMVSYSFFESYLAAAIIYWAFSALLEVAAAKLEKVSGRYRRA